MKTSWQFVDVLGLDAELLAMVPSPTCAVLLLFPISDKYEAHRREEEERLRAAGHDAPASAYFMRQTIGNACGTIGLIHAIANNQHRLGFVEGSSLKKFLSDTAAMSPSERAERLEQDQSIRASHESSAHEGQTEAPSVDEKVDLHFIALVNVDDSVYELGEASPFPRRPASPFPRHPESPCVDRRHHTKGGRRGAMSRGVLRVTLALAWPLIIPLDEN
ncbi:ubiquitin carboxyl-terminal hydrolase isozyme L3 isoform X5 [Lampetra fluviatilis]